MSQARYTSIPKSFFQKSVDFTKEYNNVGNMEYDDYPSQDDHFHGLEEEMYELDYCNDCGHAYHPSNLIRQKCENCWDEEFTNID